MFMEVDITCNCKDDSYFNEETKNIKLNKPSNILERFFNKFNSESKTLNNIEYSPCPDTKKTFLEDKFITKSSIESEKKI